MGKKEFVYLEVTTKRLYYFEKGSINGWSNDKVVQDWFINTEIGSGHATRDGHKVGNTQMLVSIKGVSMEDYTDELKRYHEDMRKRKGWNFKKETIVTTTGTGYDSIFPPEGD
jgi:hypothetical protein